MDQLYTSRAFKLVSTAEDAKDAERRIVVMDNYIHPNLCLLAASAVE
jgi:hypothetical protein